MSQSGTPASNGSDTGAHHPSPVEGIRTQGLTDLFALRWPRLATPGYHIPNTTTNILDISYGDAAAIERKESESQKLSL